MASEDEPRLEPPRAHHRFARRLISRLYAERDRVIRWRLGAAGEEWRYVARDVTAAPRAGAPPASVTIGFAPAAELLARPEAWWMTARELEPLLEAGDRMLTATVAGEIAYRAVVTHDQARVAVAVGRHAALLPALVVSLAYAHPAHRGRGIQGAALDWLAGEAARERYRQIVAWTAAWNRSSRRAFAKAGFRPLPTRAN